MWIKKSLGQPIEGCCYRPFQLHFVAVERCAPHCISHRFRTSIMIYLLFKLVSQQCLWRLSLCNHHIGHTSLSPSCVKKSFVVKWSTSAWHPGWVVCSVTDCHCVAATQAHYKAILFAVWSVCPLVYLHIDLSRADIMWHKFWWEELDSWRLNALTLVLKGLNTSVLYTLLFSSFFFLRTTVLGYS